jgi:AcrR family transcriptional regulator
MQRQYQDKKEEILKAAKKVFGQYGFDKTTLDDIARVVGIKKNSLYYYYSNKQALFSALINDEAREVFNSFNKILNSKKSASKKLKDFIKVSGKHQRERASLYTTTVKAFLEIQELIRTMHQDLIDKLSNILNQILQEGIRNGEFRKHNTKELACYLLEMSVAIEQREYQISNAEFMHEVDFDKIDRMIQTIVDYIINGIKR